MFYKNSSVEFIIVLHTAYQYTTILANRDHYIKVIELSGSSMFPPNKPSLKTISPSIFSPVISKRAVWYRDIALSFVAHNSIKLVSNSLLKPFP